MSLVRNRERFSAWLQEELGKRDWSQSDLSKMSGLHRAIISKTILGASTPTPETLEAIAKGLSIPKEHVFQVAGLLPQKREVDEETEELNHLLELLTPDKRKIAKSILNALLEGPAQAVPARKPRPTKAKA